jgi:predicted metal-dependent hydrolase
MSSHPDVSLDIPTFVSPPPSPVEELEHFIEQQAALIRHQSELLEQQARSFSEMRGCADAQLVLMQRLSEAHANDEQRIKELEEQLRGVAPLHVEVVELRAWKRDFNDWVSRELRVQVQHIQSLPQ